VVEYALGLGAVVMSLMSTRRQRLIAAV
jgi:hypothetical protein